MVKMQLFNLSAHTLAAAPPSLRSNYGARKLCSVVWLLGLLSLLNLATAQAAELTASVDRKDVVMNEHVVLTLSLINSDERLRAEGVSPNVDLSVLTKDFDLGTPHVENNFNIYRGRGRSTSALSVDLFPRRDGRLIIPAFTIDDLSTAPIMITARKLPPGSVPEIFHRSGVSKQTVWQREQLVAWLDVYHRVQLKTASIGEYISTEPMAIELMEHRDLPQSERKETVKGVSYDVTRIAWALFPKQSGELSVYLPDVWIVTADGRKLHLPHEQQRVTVKALPADVTADIAVGKPTLTQSALSPAPSVNNISTWTLTVRGPFSHFSLPDVLPLPPLPQGIKIYGDRAQRDTETATAGMITVTSYTLSALPQHGGNFDLPPLRVPYFDTERGVMDVVESPGPHLVVPTASAATTPTENMNAAKMADQTTKSTGSSSYIWQVTTAVFALLWLITMILLWKRPRPQTPTVNSNAPPARPTIPAVNHHPLQAKLLAVFGSRTLEQGLSAWEAQRGSDAALRDTVRAVQQLCYGQGKDKDSAALQRAVDEAIARIRSAAPHTAAAANDPWRPETFAVTPSRQ
jgi:hypothetical protein